MEYTEALEMLMPLFGENWKDIYELIFDGAWHNLTYEALAEKYKCSSSNLENEGSTFFSIVRERCGEGAANIKKNRQFCQNLVSCLEWLQSSQEGAPASEQNIDQRLRDVNEAIVSNRYQQFQAYASQELAELIREPAVHQFCWQAYRLVLSKRGNIRTLPSIQVVAKEFSLKMITSLGKGTSEYGPLEMFAGYLAILLEAQECWPFLEPLTEWGFQYYESVWELMIADLRTCYEEHCEGRQSSLLIELAQCSSASESEQYRLSGWLIGDVELYRSQCKTAQPLTVPGVEPEQSYSISEIESLLPLYLSKACDLSKTNVDIHVFVPGKLVNYPFDKWHDKDEDVIGHDYPVVMRLSDRLKPHRASPLWHRKGRQYNRVLQEPNSHQFFDHMGNTESVKAKSFRLTREEEAQNLLGLQLLESREGGTDTLVSVLMKTGLPFAIWHRGSTPSHIAIDEIQHLLQRCCLQRLPITVQGVRCEAIQRDREPYQIRESVSVLWDDPFLVPPDVWEKPAS